MKGAEPAGGHRRTKDGSLEALARERQRVLEYLVRRVGSRETAEEILHSAYLKAFQSFKFLRCEEHVTAWFFRIVRTGAADHFRRLRREKGVLESYRRENVGKAAREVIRGDRGRCVLTALDRLRPDYREALVRIAIEGLDPSDWAVSLGISANNARVRTHRARRALRRELLRICGPCAERRCIECRCRRASGRRSTPRRV